MSASMITGATEGASGSPGAKLGKKHLQETNEYQEWDYLKGSGPAAPEVSRMHPHESTCTCHPPPSPATPCPLPGQPFSNAHFWFDHPHPARPPARPGSAGPSGARACMQARALPHFPSSVLPPPPPRPSAIRLTRDCLPCS